MRGIFRSETEPRRHQLRSQLLETDHANTAHAVTGIQLGFEWGRKTPPNYLGIDAVVQQHPPVDDAVDGVEEHKSLALNFDYATASRLFTVGQLCLPFIRKLFINNRPLSG